MDISKIDAGYKITKPAGGSVGHVEILSGTCEGKPFKAVVKTQKKWERHGDPLSWRREYDLYVSDTGKIFTKELRWPKCYHAEINDDETKLWLEYIEGVSDADLTVEMFEKIAEGLGRFHGKFPEKPELKTENLCTPDSMKNFYHYNRSKSKGAPRSCSHTPKLYDYIRSADCEIPPHLRKMIIYMDEKSDETWAEIEKLPVVLRHGDFFPPNIFYANGQIILIDWDSAGWSYAGEDLVSLITDTYDTARMVRHFQKCVPAYVKGFSEVSGRPIKNPYVYERIVMHMGYRLIDDVNWRNVPKPPNEKKSDLEVLQKIYEMGLLVKNANKARNCGL